MISNPFRNWYIVFRSKDTVLTICEDTLKIMGLTYNFFSDNLSINNTKTIVKVRQLGSYSVLSFIVQDKNSTKEKYIKKVLLKYIQNR